MIVLCIDKFEFNCFCKNSCQANISSYAHVMTVGRGNQQQLTKHLKTSWTNKWMKIHWVAVCFIVVKHYPLCYRVHGHHFVQIPFFSTCINAVCMSVRLEFFTANVAMNGTTSATVVQWLTCAVKPRPLHLQYHRLCAIGEKTNTVFPINNQPDAAITVY